MDLPTLLDTLSTLLRLPREQATVEFGLNVGLAEQHARRAAVDHAADGRAVRFTEVGDAKESAEGAAGHGWA